MNIGNQANMTSPDENINYLYENNLFSSMKQYNIENAVRMHNSTNNSLFDKKKFSYKSLTGAFLIVSLSLLAIGLLVYGLEYRKTYLLKNEKLINESNYLNLPECGRPKIEPYFGFERIINGNASKPHSWPWMVSIGFYGKKKIYSHICGGSLISKRFILTAAHCVQNTTLSEDLKESTDHLNSLIRIFIGLNNRVADIDKNDTYFAEKIIIHPNFDLESLQNDIALIKLNKSIIESNFIEYVCINKDHHLNLDEFVYAIGWGVVNMASKAVATNLKQVRLSVLPNKRCDDFNLDPRKQACIGTEEIKVEENVKDTCYGDSGGPVMAKFKNFTNWFQVGIVSYGDKNCSGTGVYTLVSYYYNWILDTIALNF